MSFAGTWMKLETIILSKLTQEQNKTLHVITHKWEMNNENTWTHGGEQHTLGPVVGSVEGGRASGRRADRYRAEYLGDGYIKGEEKSTKEMEEI